MEWVGVEVYVGGRWKVKVGLVEEGGGGWRYRNLEIGKPGFIILALLYSLQDVDAKYIKYVLLSIHGYSFKKPRPDSLYKHTSILYFLQCTVYNAF